MSLAHTYACTSKKNHHYDKIVQFGLEISWLITTQRVGLLAWLEGRLAVPFEHNNIIEENSWRMAKRIDLLLTFKRAGLFNMFTKGSRMSTFCRPKNTAAACTTTPETVLH